MRNTFNKFFLTTKHTCGYLPNKIARNLIFSPNLLKSDDLYTDLAQQGFRRNGQHLYRPACQHCQSCIPVRIAVKEFVPNRNQSRTWKRNQDLCITPCPAEYRQEHFDLYKLYLSSRHLGGGMDNSQPNDYKDYLISSWIETVFYEIRQKEKLLAVIVIDHLKNSLSAVYTFFHPEYQKRSLGKFAILFGIEKASRLGLKWLYLGYWVRQCQKMSYKNEYKPLECYIYKQWQRLSDKTILPDG